MYSKNPLFPYADGKYMILPVGLPERFYTGSGEAVKEKDYVICFTKEATDEIKKRFIKDYAEHYRKENHLS